MTRDKLLAAGGITIASPKGITEGDGDALVQPLWHGHLVSKATNGAHARQFHWLIITESPPRGKPGQARRRWHSRENETANHAIASTVVVAFLLLR